MQRLRGLTTTKPSVRLRFATWTISMPGKGHHNQPLVRNVVYPQVSRCSVLGQTLRPASQLSRNPIGGQSATKAIMAIRLSAQRGSGMRVLSHLLDGVKSHDTFWPNVTTADLLAPRLGRHVGHQAMSQKHMGSSDLDAFLPKVNLQPSFQISPGLGRGVACPRCGLYDHERMVLFQMATSVSSNTLGIRVDDTA